MNWQERAEKADAELAKRRAQKPIKYLYRVIDCFGHDVLRDDPKDATILETIPLFAAPVPAVAAPAAPTDEQIHAAYRVALGQSIRERDMPEIRKFAIALLQSAPQSDKEVRHD